MKWKVSKNKTGQKKHIYNSNTNPTKLNKNNNTIEEKTYYKFDGILSVMIISSYWVVFLYLKTNLTFSISYYNISYLIIKTSNKIVFNIFFSHTFS